MHYPLPNVVEAVFVAPLPQQSDELPNPVAEDTKGHERQQPEQQQPRLP